MKYLSSRAPNLEKDVPEETLNEVRAYIKKKFPGGLKKTNTFGEIQDAILAYRTKDGGRLLLNQAAPIYLHLCWYMKL